MTTIKISDLVTLKEASELVDYVSRGKRNGKNTQNMILKWLDKQPLVMDRFRQHGVIKAYGSLLLEYHLKLT